MVSYPIPLYTDSDSTSAIDDVKSNVKHACTKRFNIGPHFIPKFVETKHALKYSPLTKALPIINKCAIQLLILSSIFNG